MQFLRRITICKAHVLCAEAHVSGIRVGDHHPHARVAEVALAVEQHHRAICALKHRVLHSTSNVRITPKPTGKKRKGGHGGGMGWRERRGGRGVNTRVLTMMGKIQKKRNFKRKNTAGDAPKARMTPETSNMNSATWRDKCHRKRRGKNPQRREWRPRLQDAASERAGLVTKAGSTLLCFFQTALGLRQEAFLAIHSYLESIVRSNSKAYSNSHITHSRKKRMP